MSHIPYTVVSAYPYTVVSAYQKWKKSEQSNHVSSPRAHDSEYKETATTREKGVSAHSRWIRSLRCVLFSGRSYIALILLHISHPFHPFATPLSFALPPCNPSLMTYPNALFSAFSFIGFLLCLIPLYWHLEGNFRPMPCSLSESQIDRLFSRL